MFLGTCFVANFFLSLSFTFICAVPNSVFVYVMSIQAEEKVSNSNSQIHFVKAFFFLTDMGNMPEIIPEKINNYFILWTPF